jgi:hypothetical protein
MADFTALTIDTGVGDYHFNRFRIAFQPPNGKSAAALAHDMTFSFPKYLNSSFATVQESDKEFDRKKALKFKGIAELCGVELPNPHHDWVGRVWVDGNVGFTGQTLKREFSDAGEDLEVVGDAITATFVPGFSNPTLMPSTAIQAIGLNRKHFLAGRRSWRIGEGKVFGVSGDVFVLETIAVERFSDGGYKVADLVIGLENRIPDVWIALLNNFVDQNNLTVVPQRIKGGWKNKNRVDFVQDSFDSLYDLWRDGEFQTAYPLYKTILPYTPEDVKRLMAELGWPK